jgi:hypothetical protein
MFNIAIDNPTLEHFYQETCKEDHQEFIKKMTHLVELYNAKEQIETSFNEWEQYKEGKLKLKSLGEVLADLDD